MSYGGEIASAYVRIRPDLSGFREKATAGVKQGLTAVQADIRAVGRTSQETANQTVNANHRAARSFHEVGVAAQHTREQTNELRRSVGEFAKIVGVAFGAEIAVEFAKAIVEHAADIQKQTEVIKAQFGAAAESVLSFSEKGAAALGVSAHAAETTAARMGILFKNIGVGKEQAAAATVDMLKLAGSLSAIRGIDPALALRNLPLAIAGNLRSLKQLGIATDQNQIKIAAHLLGLTQTITQGLTPGQRALAIVAIATAHLSEFQKQAAAHSGDLRNQTRMLAAEWDNAKDKLGASLIPAIARLVTFLVKVLPDAVGKAQTAFGDFAASVRDAASLVEPAWKPVLNVIEMVKKAFSDGGKHVETKFGFKVVTSEGIQGGLANLRRSFSQLTPLAKAATVAVAGIGIALAAAFATAFPITATILAIFALGVGLQEAYKHSARFREIVDQMHTTLNDRLLPAIQRVAEKVGPTLVVIETTAKKVFGDFAVIVGQGVKAAVAIWQHFGGTIKRVVTNSFGGALKIIQDIFKIIGGVFDVERNVLTGKWSDAWKALKGIVADYLHATKVLIVTFGKDIATIFTGIWTVIERVVLEGISKALIPLEKVLGFFSDLLGKIGIHLGNPAKDLRDTIAGMIEGLDAKAAAKSMTDAIAKNTAAALSAKTRDPDIAIASVKIGKHIRDTIKKGADEGTNAGTGNAGAAAVDTAVQQAQKQLGTLKTKLKELVAQNRIDIQAAVRDAKSNLISIGSGLSDQIGQIIDQPFAVAQQKIQAAQNRLALIYDTKNAKLEAETQRLARLQAQLGLLNDKRNLDQLRHEVTLPGGGLLSMDPKRANAQLKALLKGANQFTRPSLEQFALDYRSALLTQSSDKLGLKQAHIDAKRQSAETALGLKSDRLAVAQDQATQMKILAQRTIADLTAALSGGAITLKTFNKKLASLLAADHVSYRKAGALLGTAFATGFRANVKGIAAQAAALAAGPQQPGTGLEPKISRPELVVLRDQLKVQRLREQIANKQLAIAKKQATAAAKTQKTLEAMHSVQLGDNAKSLTKNPGKSSKTARDLSGTTG